MACLCPSCAAAVPRRHLAASMSAGGVLFAACPACDAPLDLVRPRRVATVVEIAIFCIALIGTVAAIGPWWAPPLAGIVAFLSAPAVIMACWPSASLTDAWRSAYADVDIVPRVRLAIAKRMMRATQRPALERWLTRRMPLGGV